MVPASREDGMSYHYLFTDEDGATLARVRYSFTPLHRADRNGPAEGDELVIEECIPSTFEIDERAELTLRHHAAMLDLDEADSRAIDREPDEPTSSIHWGIRG
jgi:hypothetical protein